MSSRSIVRSAGHLSRRHALRRTVPLFPSLNQAPILPNPITRHLSKPSMSTMSHDHLKASKLFSCQGLTAVVTGALLQPS